MSFKIIINFDAPNNTVVEGNIQKLKKDKWDVYIDGWLENDILPDENKNRIGVFNLILWDPTTACLKIENDLLGQRPLYISLNNGKIIISDNYWNVFSDLDRIDIDYDSIEQMLNFRRLVPSWKTFDKKIIRLPAGGLYEYKKGNSHYCVKQKLRMEQAPDESIGLKDAVNQLHESLLNLFSNINNIFNSFEIWFGNSGGLDSRIIPAYAHLFGIKINGFIVSNNKPLGLYNQSIHSGERIANYFGFPFLKINYYEGSGWERMIQDLYVNPFGPSNFHKNPKYDFFRNKLVLNGGSSFTIANDNNFWKIAEQMNNPIRSFIDKYLIRSNVKLDMLDEYEDLIRYQFEDFNVDDTFSLMRTMHQTYLNVTSPMGAFESMSFAGEFQYIYHPYATSKALKWPKHLFYDRIVQIELFNKHFPDLLSIPDQKGRYWNDDKKTKSFSNKINMRIRKSGLDYPKWLKSSWFMKTFKQVEKYIYNSNSKLAIENFNRLNNYNKYQDQLDMIKISLIIAHMERRVSPK